MTTYVGRFAPSPSGPLHLGSLYTALISYLDAKHHRGQWLVRIEDIDPPRQPPDATAQILHSLSVHGLVSDCPTLYQSSRREAYQRAINMLLDSGNAYWCRCTRAQIKARHPLYQGQCQAAGWQRDAQINQAVRWHNTASINQFEDRWQGLQIVPAATDNSEHTLHNYVQHMTHEDCILQRKDGLFAYNLAVVLDDIDQGITHITRGIDLLDTTLLQINLAHHLGAIGFADTHSTITYAHNPILTNADGYKLSKQNHAPALNDETPLENLRLLLSLLGIDVPASLKNVNHILHYALEQWPSVNIGKLPTQIDIESSSKSEKNSL